jgi:putative peptidoglycan lipid II flippase
VSRPPPAPAGNGPPQAGPIPPGRTDPAALGRSTAILAAGTFLSRLSGFARVSVAAFILGLYGLGNAYNIANSIPNIIYDLLLGGILSATLIPVFVDEFRRDDIDGRDRAVSAILTLAGAVLVVLTIALYVLAPLVIHLYLILNHHTGERDELAVGVSLLRFFAPQVFFLGAIVIGTALLNARRKFATAAFSPVVNNVIAIAALIATRLVAPSLDPAVFRHDHGGLAVLGLGTTLGYVAQFLVQLPAMARTGVRFRPVWAPRHPAVRRVIGLSAWLLGVVIANQIAYNLIVVVSAGTDGSNDFAAYQTAYQLFQLPYALLAVSIASAIMPDLAERWAAHQWTAFLARVIRGLRVTLALLIPAAVGYAFVAGPVVDLGLRHFQVSSASATVISQTLAVFALGLPGFSAFLLLVRALQAMKDARAMFAIYAAENALTVILAVALYSRFGDRGLAAAFVGPYTLAAVAAAIYLHRRVGALGGIYTARALVRTLLAAAAMAAVLFGVTRLLPAGGGDTMLAVRLAAEVVVGGLVFLTVAHWLEIDDLHPVLQPIRAALGRAHLIRAGSAS